MLSSLRWFWHPFGIVEFCTFNFSLGGIAKIAGIVAAPFTGGASLAITAASIQHDTAYNAAKDAERINAENAAAAERIAANNRAAAEAAQKTAAMQSASVLPFSQAFSSSPLGGGSQAVGGVSIWLILGIGAAFLFFILRK